MSTCYEKINEYPLFIAGDDGYHSFRIPAVITLPNGRILAFAEGRRNDCGDTGDIDIVLKISDDGGQSFGPLKVVAAGGGDTAGNPCPVYDRVTGKIVMVFNRNSGDGYQDLVMVGKALRSVHMTESGDDGESWGPERDISAQARHDDWTWHGAGPCHGLQTASGRLIIPCDHAVLDQEKQDSGPYFSHTLYSDDHGASWLIGKDIAPATTECAAAQLKDGRVLMSMRMLPNPWCRTLAVSYDEGVTFPKCYMVKEQPDPCCQGTLLAVDKKGEEILLEVNASHPEERIRLVIHESADGGDTWEDAFVVTKTHAAYSDITQINRDHIAVLYETGEESPYERIDWVVLKMNE